MCKISPAYLKNFLAIVTDIQPFSEGLAKILNDHFVLGCEEDGPFGQVDSSQHMFGSSSSPPISVGSHHFPEKK